MSDVGAAPILPRPCIIESVSYAVMSKGENQKKRSTQCNNGSVKVMVLIRRDPPSPHTQRLALKIISRGRQKAGFLGQEWEEKN